MEGILDPRTGGFSHMRVHYYYDDVIVMNARRGFDGMEKDMDDMNRENRIGIGLTGDSRK